MLRLDYKARLGLAFALSIALHEIAAGAVPPGAPPARDELITNVAIVRISVRPTPTPVVPTPPPLRRVLARATVTSGVAARKEPIRRVASARPRPPKVSHAKPVWDLPVGGHGAGAGNNEGAGSPGNGGTGTGAGTRGSGGDAINGTQPCGFVTFSDPHGIRYDPETGGAWVDVQMSVHFADGHSEAALLDYPWYYPNAGANPFENQDVPMLFQRPPSGKRDEPDVVQYVIEHSSNGYTLLKDCP